MTERAARVGATCQMQGAPGKAPLVHGPALQLHVHWLGGRVRVGSFSDTFAFDECSRTSPYRLVTDHRKWGTASLNFLVGRLHIEYPIYLHSSWTILLVIISQVNSNENTPKQDKSDRN